MARSDQSLPHVSMIPTFANLGDSVHRPGWDALAAAVLGFDAKGFDVKAESKPTSLVEQLGFTPQGELDDTNIICLDDYR